MMIPPDLALAALINHTAEVYQTSAPVYMTYTERTHVEGANRTKDIDRSVMVRVADDYAVMRDLPAGGESTGQAFPIIPYFDPFSNFTFSYFANLKKVDITLNRRDVYSVPVPAPDSDAVVVPYFSWMDPRYAPDATPDHLHWLIDPTPRVGNNTFYFSDITEDPQTGLPSHVVMRLTGSDEVIALDYSVVDGHWLITHGTFTSTQQVFGFSFKVVANVTYDDFTFPPQAPDPRLAASPSPSPAPSQLPLPSATPNDAP
jgi:hypothetical protein